MTSGKPIVAPLDRNRKNVIGYFENTESQNFKNFESMAGNLKDDCRFWAGVGPNLAQERLSGDNIVFKPEGHNSPDQVFMGDISNYLIFLGNFYRFLLNLKMVFVENC